MTANMTDATQGVRLRVSDPELIPAKRYYDEEFFKLERSGIIRRMYSLQSGTVLTQSVRS